MNNSIISWGNQTIFGEDVLFPSRKLDSGAAQLLTAAWMWNLCDNNVLKTFILSLPSLCTTPAALPLTLRRGFLITKNVSNPQGYFGRCVIPTFLRATKLNPEFPLVALVNSLFLAGSWEMCLYAAIEVLKKILQIAYLVTIFFHCWFVRLTSQRNASKGEEERDVKSTVSPCQPSFPPNICQQRTGCRKNKG